LRDIDAKVLRFAVLSEAVRRDMQDIVHQAVSQLAAGKNWAVVDVYLMMLDDARW